MNDTMSDTGYPFGQNPRGGTAEPGPTHRWIDGRWWVPHTELSAAEAQVKELEEEVEEMECVAEANEYLRERVANLEVQNRALRERLERAREARAESRKAMESFDAYAGRKADERLDAALAEIQEGGDTKGDR